jgi:hypothetical protein
MQQGNILSKKKKFRNTCLLKSNVVLCLARNQEERYRLLSKHIEQSCALWNTQAMHLATATGSLRVVAYNGDSIACVISKAAGHHLRSALSGIHRLCIDPPRVKMPFFFGDNCPLLSSAATGLFSADAEVPRWLIFSTSSRGATQWPGGSEVLRERRACDVVTLRACNLGSAKGMSAPTFSS